MNHPKERWFAVVIAEINTAANVYFLRINGLVIKMLSSTWLNILNAGNAQSVKFSCKSKKDAKKLLADVDTMLAINADRRGRTNICVMLRGENNKTRK